MGNIKIIADSSCDIPDQFLDEYDITIIPYYCSYDKENYFKEKLEVKINDFYHTLRTQNVFPKTSMPTTGDFLSHFKKYTEEGKEIIHFSLTSKFSGSYQNSVNAKNMLLEECPNAIIEVIDSHQAAMGEGLVVLEAARMAKAGFTSSEIINKINLLKETARVILTVDSLEYLKKGGRIGKTSALAGNILNIKPTIIMENGELMPYDKVRGRKKALSRIIELTTERIGNQVDKYDICVISSDSIKEAEEVKQVLISEHGFKIPYPIADIGVTIGAHIGPTVVGICYILKYEFI